jgi:hypothetical protein
MSPAERRARRAEIRARQGLGPTITDPDTLRQLAARVADGLVRQKGGADEHDGGGPTVASRRRSTETPSTTRRAARKAGGVDGSS